MQLQGDVAADVAVVAVLDVVADVAVVEIVEAVEIVAACSLPPLWVAEMHVRHQRYIVTTISMWRVCV